MEKDRWRGSRTTSTAICNNEGDNGRERERGKRLELIVVRRTATSRLGGGDAAKGNRGKEG